MKCPNCGSRNLGKLKNNLFFCRECFSEVEIKKDILKVYSIDADGCLKAIDKSA